VEEAGGATGEYFELVARERELFEVARAQRRAGGGACQDARSRGGGELAVRGNSWMGRRRRPPGGPTLDLPQRERGAPASRSPTHMPPSSTDVDEAAASERAFHGRHPTAHEVRVAAAVFWSGLSEPVCGGLLCVGTFPVRRRQSWNQWSHFCDSGASFTRGARDVVERRRAQQLSAADFSTGAGR